MSSKLNEKLKELSIENIIWLVYIFIAIFALISNYYESKYYYTNNIEDRKKQRYILIDIS